MKAKLISDTTLKITISMSDLEERGMELADFIVPQEKTEDFFYTMLEEVELPDTFKIGGMLSFRVTPKKDRVDIFVTKSDLDTDFDMADLSRLEELSQLSPEDFFESLNQEFSKKGDKTALERLAEAEAADEEDLEDDQQEGELPPSDKVHYVMAFDRLEEVVTFCQVLDCPVYMSELYKYQGTYHLSLLFDIEDKPVGYDLTIKGRLLEYARESSKSRAFLREYAHLLWEIDIFEELVQLDEVVYD